MDVLDVLNSNLTGTVRLTGSIASAVCLAVISLILLLLVFYKAYTTTLQRLLLYLTIITVIQEVCLTVNCATQFEYSEHETFCDVISSFWQWSDTVGYLLTLAMIVYLPYKIYQQFKGDPFPRLSRSKCCCVALECLFIFVVLVLPLIYILPLAHCNYYTTPHVCTVSLMRFREDNCTSQLTLALPGGKEQKSLGLEHAIFNKIIALRCTAASKMLSVYFSSNTSLGRAKQQKKTYVAVPGRNQTLFRCISTA